MGIPYSALREGGAQTQYGPNKTAVTADVTEAGFIFAFIIIALSFFIILPGIRGSQVCGHRSSFILSHILHTSHSVGPTVSPIRVGSYIADIGFFLKGMCVELC